MKGRFVGIAVIALMFLALFATGAPAADNLAKKQVLTMGFDAGDAKTLDPHMAATTVDRATVDMVFNGLVRYPLGNQVGFEPDLAESWKVSEDGKSWTFKLKKGVKFHPFPGNEGYEMTSDDVVYSLQRAADTKTSAYASEYSDLAFKAVDPATVEITVKKPMSETLFLAKVSNYAGGFIVSRKAIEAQGNDWFKMHPVGTGPFVFKSYEPQQKTTLTGNPRYFRGKPVLEEVVVRYMPSVSSREFGLRTGELDIIEGLKEEQWMQKIGTFPLVSVKAF
ncbi:MAG: ABC transporter substrate-binding protein, partial [Desulfobacteraceae bacterium]|nr:ABC transporter substrate-binding protein [Desulfobacteraceae bacterium]